MTSMQPVYKMLLIGNSAVGKSCLLFRFADDHWSETNVTTIGVDFKIKTLDLDHKSVKLQIFDTAGQEKFKTITESSYRKVSGVMIVYDITDRESFDNLNTWLIEIEKKAPNVCKILVGNKSDLEEKRKVSYEHETSAKNANNVEKSFVTMTKEIIATENEKVMSKNGITSH